MYVVRFRECIKSAESYPDDDPKQTTEVIVGTTENRICPADIRSESVIPLSAGRLAVACASKNIFTNEWDEPELDNYNSAPIREISIPQVFFRYTTSGIRTVETDRIRQQDKSGQWNFVYSSSHTTRVVPVRHPLVPLYPRQAMISAIPNSLPTSYPYPHSSGGVVGHGGGGKRDEHYLAVGERAVDLLIETIGKPIVLDGKSHVSFDSVLCRSPEVDLAIRDALEQTHFTEPSSL